MQAKEVVSGKYEQASLRIDIFVMLAFADEAPGID